MWHAYPIDVVSLDFSALLGRSLPSCKATAIATENSCGYNRYPGKRLNEQWKRTKSSLWRSMSEHRCATLCVEHCYQTKVPTAKMKKQTSKCCQTKKPVHVITMARGAEAADASYFHF